MEIRAGTKISYGLLDYEWKISIDGRRVGPPIRREKDAALICWWLQARRKSLQQQSKEVSL